MAGYGRIAAIAVLVVVGLESTTHAQSLLERLEKRLGEAGAAVQAPANELPRAAGEDEAAPPGYLGLTADTRNGRVEVVSVRADGPAAAAGVRPGDRLVSIGDVEVASLDDVSEIIGKLPAGSRVELVVQRSGRNQKLALTLGARDEGPEFLPRPDEPAPDERPLAAPASLGVRAVPVTADVQRRYGLTVRRGAVIESIQRGSAADTYGLPLGAAIVAVDGARVDSPEDLAAIIAGARPGDTVEISYYQRDQVFRKRVRLGPSSVAAPVPGQDRPLLRRLERALESPLPGREGDGFAQMQAQLEALQAKVDALEERIGILEGRRPPAAEREEQRQPPVEKGAERRAPELEPLEP